MQPVSPNPAIGVTAARARHANEIAHPCTLTAGSGALKRLEDWIFLYQLADPVDKDAQLRRKVTALRIHY